MAMRFGGQGVALPKNQFGTNAAYLQPGAAMYLPPGTWVVQTDGVANLQMLDPVLNAWAPAGGPAMAGGNTSVTLQIDSDGSNFRLSNTTSTPVGAYVTAAGSGYTSAPVVTPSEGNATFRAIVGGAVSTSVTIVTGGTGYVYPPVIMVEPPPPGGVPCIMAAGAITGGVLQGITVIQQGAGYQTPPYVNITNDYRDTSGRGAVATSSLVGAGTVTAVVLTDGGSTIIASGNVPTLTFAGGGGTGAAATALMDWAVTALGVTSGGAGYTGTNVTVAVSGAGATLPASPYLNSRLQNPRSHSGTYQLSVSGGALVAAGQSVQQYARVTGTTAANIYLVPNQPGTTAAALTATVGGVGSQVYFQTTQG